MSQLSDSYSLWLKLPAGPVYKKLEQEIAAQAKEHSSPLFEPHVTLLGGIEGDKDKVLESAKGLAEMLKVCTSSIAWFGWAAACNACTSDD